MLQSTATPYTALGNDGPGTAAGYDAGVERGGFSAGEEQNRSESHLSLQGRRKSKRGRGGGRRQQHSDSDTAFGPVVSSEMTRTRVNAAPGRVYAACIGKEIRTEEAAQLLEATQWVRQRVISEEDSDDSQYFRREIQVPDSDSRRTLHAFLFDFGCVVCWNCSQNDERMLVRGILPVVEQPHEPEEDDLKFVLGHMPGRSTTARIRNNTVILSINYPIEMFAISLAFAQSVKLSVHEGEVDDVIQQSRAYPETLEDNIL